MSEAKIEVNGIDGLKTQTALKVITEKGEEIERLLVTKVTFESEIDPHDIAQIHRLLAAGHEINIAIYSPQLVMDLES